MPEVQPKPPIIAKPSPPAHSPDTPDSVKLNITKKYVLPPRPKPGRKPSSEAPPSRRKAQNREAQRAFRERRASAVQELEKRLGLEAQKHALEQQQLKDMINKLASENEKLRQMRTPPSMSPSAMSPLSPNPVVVTGGAALSPGVMSPGSSATSPGFHMSPYFDPAMEILDRVLDERLPVPQTPKSSSPPKKSPAASSPVAFKRLSPKEPPTQGISLVATDWKFPAVPLRRRLSSLETDFTHRFKDSRRRLSSTSASPFSFPESTPNPLDFKKNEFHKRPEDRCGFCTDDTPCVCMEAAARERANMRDIETLGESLPLFTYSRAKEEKSLASQNSSPVALSPASSPQPQSSGPRQECTGDPGTCMQCQEDPMSTLFCTTVAAKPKAATVASGTFIPAQAAYRTLSRHRSFSAADFSTLVSSLDTRGTQVEVNSVAKVLRMLDRRLYN